MFCFPCRAMEQTKSPALAQWMTQLKYCILHVSEGVFSYTSLVFHHLPTWSFFTVGTTYGPRNDLFGKTCTRAMGHLQHVREVVKVWVARFHKCREGCSKMRNGFQAMWDLMARKCKFLSVVIINWDSNRSQEASFFKFWNRRPARTYAWRNLRAMQHWSKVAFGAQRLFWTFSGGNPMTALSWCFWGCPDITLPVKIEARLSYNDSFHSPG